MRYEAFDMIMVFAISNFTQSHVVRQEGGSVVIDVGHHDLHLDLVKLLKIQQKQNAKHSSFSGAALDASLERFNAKTRVFPFKSSSSA